jgi:phage-related protein
MAVLLYTNKISQTVSGSFTENVVVNQFGDSYAQTIRPGINTAQETWTVSWVGLTQAEARGLKLLFQSCGGDERIVWTSPLGSGTETWTVTDHSGKLAQGGGTTWEYSCQLVRRY